MRAVRNLLILVIAVEFIVGGYFVASRAERTATPVVNASRLDPLTREDLNKLVAEADKGDSGDWRALAEFLLGNGYYTAAEQCFHHASQWNPNDLQAEYGRGFCHERIGNTSVAITMLSRTADRADPQLATTCWYQIGRCYLREEKTEEAEAAFRRIPDFTPAAYQLAKLLIRVDRADEAVPIIEQQLNRTPNSLKLIQLRMHAAESMGDSELVRTLRDREERAEYQLVLEYNQSFISMFAARYGLARLLSSAMRLKTDGSLADRRAALAKPVKVIREHALWQYRSVLIAAAHVEAGFDNTSQARRLINEIAEHTQTGPDLLDLRALVAEAEGDPQAAVGLWKRAIAMKPSPEFFESIYQSAAPIPDSDRETILAQKHLWLAIANYRVNELDEASRHLEFVGMTLHEDPLYHFYRAETQRIAGELTAAATSYERCLQYAPGHGRARARLTEIRHIVESRESGGLNP